MQFFFFLFFLLICVLDGFKTWIKPFSIRLTNYALLDRLQDGIRDETGRPKDLNIPSKSLLSPSTRWEFMYRATIDYCQQHQQLPPAVYTTSFEGQDDLNLGAWVHRQKVRYSDNENISPLGNEQLNMLMAIDKFREWAEDPLTDNDVRWEFMYQATVDYCQQHRKLPPNGYQTDFEGIDDLNLGYWVKWQKDRFDGKEGCSSLSVDQLNKLMAIDAFRGWAEDPLLDDDVRWNFMYRAFADYCQQHQQLPPAVYTSSFEGHDDVNIGIWVNTQKNRYNVNEGVASLTDEQLNKLMAVDEFREWAENPLRDDDVRWEFMYQALVAYCKQHQQLPPDRYQTGFEWHGLPDSITISEGNNDLNLGKWVTGQKQRYDGKGTSSPLTDERLSKLMAIGEFRGWTEDPLRDDDVRWEFMYQQLLHGNFSGGYNLDGWLGTQKQRYKGNKSFAPLSEEQKTKLMASVIFRKWAEDPLRETDVRWEIHFDLLAEYCYFHHKLPPYDYKTIYERNDGTSQELNIGGWLSEQKKRYSGVTKSMIPEDRHNKLMQIPEFNSYIFSRFGSSRYSDFYNAHAKIKKSGSKIKKSTPTKQ